MPLWKQTLLNLYYHASRPARAWTRRRLASKGQTPIAILYWHRIADDRANDWTTSSEVFARQIRWLQKRFQFVSLEEAQRRIRQGENRQPCVCVTFDDGYADNCRWAIPMLADEGIPCAYFVTVQNMLEGKPFSHDLKLGHNLLPNTPEQLRAMAASGVEIGAHTMTHPDLGAIDDAGLLHREIVKAKDDLERAIGRPVRYFAFPYGLYANLSPAAFALAASAGYAGACSAYGGFNFPGDDAFHLQRISADRSLIHMKNWVTLDPRKLHVKRFQYQTNRTAGDCPDFRAGDCPDFCVSKNGTVPIALPPTNPSPSPDVHSV